MDRKEAPIAAFRTIDERLAAIRDLAYRLWEDRGRPYGSPADDWYKAELTIDWYKAELTIERGEDRHGGRTAVTSAAQRGRSKSTPKGAKPAPQP